MTSLILEDIGKCDLILEAIFGHNLPCTELLDCLKTQEYFNDDHVKCTEPSIIGLTQPVLKNTCHWTDNYML